MALIYTLTINPAVDLNLYSNMLESGKVNRTRGAVYTPNGKGINVTRVLRHFEMDSIALGFFGGFTGHYIVDELRQEDIKIMPVWVDDITRINLFVNTGSEELKLVNEGAVVSPEKQKEMLGFIGRLTAQNLLVISGSMAKGISETYYEEILNICQNQHIQFVLDISSTKLKELLKYKPLLIKPNNDELEEIYQVKLDDEQKVIEMLQFLHQEGAQNILLTMGAEGMYFFDGQDTVYFCDAPKIVQVSSACAGDGALASFLYHFKSGRGIEECLKMASAVGADIAGSNGIGELKRVESYVTQLSVRRIKV